MAPHAPFVFGALLPFTGEQAAIGTNVERTLIMAADIVNQAGGAVGIKTVDSHSDPARGMLEAQKLLSLPELEAVLGPEEPYLAASLRQDLMARSIVDFLPGVATPPRDGAPSEFRIGPSAPVIAGALAALMQKDGVTSLAIVYEAGPYGEELSRLGACEYQRASGQTATLVPISADATVDDAFRLLTVTPPDAILLIAYPKTGAKVVVNWSVSQAGARTKWYLAPTLDVDEFVDNIIPGSLDNATGISPSKQTYAGAFDTQFNARWADFPMTISYYYYDSIAVLSLAMEAARTSHTSLSDAITAVSNPPGELIGWSDLPRGLELVRQGTKINYDGLTGNVDIEANRDVQQSLLRNFWIVSGKIQHSSLPFDYSQFLTTACNTP